MWSTIIQISIGAAVAILITILVENWRRPHLTIEVTEPIDAEYTYKHVKKARFILVEVTNNPLPQFLRWMSRNAAIQCHGSVTFHYLDGQPVYQRVMPTRWSNSPEPIASRFEVDGTVFSFIDPSKVEIRSRIDIQPGESEQLGIVAKFDDDEECYGWSNENYFTKPLWRHPDWKIKPERYLVKVTVYSAGKKVSGVFRLVNNVPRNDTRLETKQTSDNLFDVDKGQRTP